MMHGLNEVWICVCLIIAREEERMSKLNGREGVAEFVWSVDSYIHMNAETTVCRIEMWFAISGLDAFQHIWTFRLMPINVFFQINYRIMILCRVLNVQFALMHSEPQSIQRQSGLSAFLQNCAVTNVFHSRTCEQSRTLFLCASLSPSLPIACIFYVLNA